MDIGTIAAIKNGKIKVVKGIKNSLDTEVEFEDGYKDQFDLIVNATGYKTGLDELIESDESYYDKFCNPTKDSFESGIHFLGFIDNGLGVIYQIRTRAPKIANTIASQNS